jgi:hypothetical protein
VSMLPNRKPVREIDLSSSWSSSLSMTEAAKKITHQK